MREKCVPRRNASAAPQHSAASSSESGPVARRYQREAAVELVKNGISIKAAARASRVHPTTIQRWVILMRSNGNMKRKPGSGAAPKVTAAHIKLTKSLTLQNQLSSARVAKELSESPAYISVWPQPTVQLSVAEIAALCPSCSKRTQLAASCSNDNSAVYKSAERCYGHKYTHQITARAALRQQAARCLRRTCCFNHAQVWIVHSRTYAGVDRSGFMTIIFPNRAKPFTHQNRQQRYGNGRGRPSASGLSTTHIPARGRVLHRKRGARVQLEKSAVLLIVSFSQPASQPA